MAALETFIKLKEAFGASTQSDNKFLRVLNSINWEEKFFADGEHYFIKGNLTFTTPELDPFQITRDWMLQISMRALLLFMMQW